MKRHFKGVRIFIYAVIIFGMAGLLIFPKDTISAAKDGLKICETVIIPSLFPFFVFASLSISTGLFDDTAFLFSPVMGIFRLSGACAPAFALGIISGFPVGAKTAVNLYQNGMCTRQEAERLLAFCNNCGPAFILGTVGVGLWNSMELGITLYAVQIISSILTGIIFGRIWHTDNKSLSLKYSKTKRLPLSKAFVASVKGSAVNIFYVCAFILFFSVAVKLLYLLDIIPMISKALAFLLLPAGLSSTVFEGIITGFFEITNGVKAAFGAVSISAFAKIVLTGIILGWAGLSVHCQTLIFIQESDLSSKPYFLGKAVQAGLSGILTFLILRLTPFYKSAFASTPKQLQAVPAYNPLHILLYTLIIILVLILVVFFIKIKGVKKKLTGG